MQIGLAKGSGSEYIAYSLPFSKFHGLDTLFDDTLIESATWPERLDIVVNTYADMCAAEKAKQCMPVFEGRVFGVVDTMDVAIILGVVDRPLPAQKLLSKLEAKIAEWKASTGPVEAMQTHAAVALMHAVVKHFFSEAEFLFDSSIRVNWAQGYLSEHGAP